MEIEELKILITSPGSYTFTPWSVCYLRLIWPKLTGILDNEVTYQKIEIC